MPSPSSADDGDRSTLPSWRSMLSGWTGIVVASAVLAWVSILALRDSVAYDPYSWVIWGREIVHLHLNTRQAATSVKPLPMLFDSIFSFTGSHLPGVWLFAARFGALLGFGAVFRLARRFGGLGAGIVAIAGFAVSNELLGYLFMRGMSEPLAAAAMVAAVDCYLLARPRAATGCLIAAAYLRPEAWPLLLVYLIWLSWPHSWFRRAGAIAVGVFVPFSWFLIDWFGARQFNRSANAATHQSQGGPLLHRQPGIATLTETWKLASGPIVVLFLIALALALVGWWRAGHSLNPARLDPLQLIVLIVAVWVIADAVLAQGHFATGAPRYLLPAEALACVVAGCLVAQIGRRLARWGSSRLIAGAALPTLVAVVLAVLIPSFVSTGRQLRTGVRQGQQFVLLGGRLAAAVRLAGGRDAVVHCGTIATRNFQVPVVAWQLDVPLDRILTTAAVPGTVFQQGDVPVIPSALAGGYRTVASLGRSPLSSWQVHTACPASHTR